MSGRSGAGLRAERGLDRSGVADFHERAVTGLEQELRVDQCAQQRFAYGGVEAPQASRLGTGQSKPGLFEELPLYSPEHVVGRSVLLGRHRLYTSQVLLTSSAFPERA